MPVPAATPMYTSWYWICRSLSIFTPVPIAADIVSLFQQTWYIAGESPRPPMTEQMRMGPQMPKWSQVACLLILGWTTFSQNPLTSPEKPPIAMQAPMLLSVPATTLTVTPPLSTPSRDSRTPILKLPNIALKTYVEITLAVKVKQMLRGAWNYRQVLATATEGQNTPVKGKAAKMKPVPIILMQAECLEPWGDAGPLFRFSSTEVMSAKNPAKTQTQLVPLSSQRVDPDGPLVLCRYSVTLYESVHPTLQTAVTTNVSMAPNRPTRQHSAANSEVHSAMVSRSVCRLRTAFLAKPAKTCSQKERRRGESWTLTATTRRVVVSPAMAEFWEQATSSPQPRMASRAVKVQRMSLSAWSRQAVPPVMGVVLASTLNSPPNPQANIMPTSNSSSRMASTRPLRRVLASSWAWLSGSDMQVMIIIQKRPLVWTCQLPVYVCYHFDGEGATLKVSKYLEMKGVRGKKGQGGLCWIMFDINFIICMSRTVDQIEADLDQENKLMYVHQKNGNYADAEKSRLKIEQLRKDHEARTLYDMEQRHKREANDLRKANDEEMAAFNDYWNKKAADITHEGARADQEMTLRHKQDHANTRKALEEEFSLKVKESSELLNLRKMEEFMVKQKNFAQAHKVQAQIQDMEKHEKQAWLDKRNEKIETALGTLRARQNVELANLHKRIKTELDELARERKIEEERLTQKHENLQRDLRNQQEKEVLNYKGEFRSRGGRDSPMRTKGSFTS